MSVQQDQSAVEVEHLAAEDNIVQVPMIAEEVVATGGMVVEEADEVGRAVQDGVMGLEELLEDPEKLYKAEASRATRT